ncbi:phosphoribosylformylglycinamidine cyclo-ligase [Helicobacter pullorum]|uniref:Phosphoribosylformylglycinamidine cyclo-ligase n=1 Tax=Helicobacter pullorum TaxID=35818 RepID=A0A377PXT9_9HELI|nr:phosphoribosylformylglycinamidine cyclo-ligase [Helicobacter pullorum]OCR19725.1 phosphoribosylformylglycinamidine cyclo-ligase [Helicobacter pullorum]STQ87455.1 phosphoribosylaminoimidazole synthetase [Helicobacter pullorum]HIS09400.1 phosphoribosylformylglycinamidine cyclo-ligase [Candidatus Scatomorpha intestinipullorum]
MQKLNYKDSGVDIAEGNALVENLKGLVKSTFNANVLGGIGSFSGAYALPSGYKEPVILAATDGVGTKLRLAIDYGILNGVGIDLVAMCVNDLICNFATPLFFLDYYATGKLDKTKALEVIKGITQGCLEAQCALIGGETAEMPGMYEKEDFDLAGFAVGIGEKEIIQRGSQAKVGDVLIALPSSGIHSNGYSLVRKILTQNNIDLESIFEGKPLIETLLTPTKIYVQTFKKLQDKINALAHITGGGLIENLPRCLPNNIDAMIEECKIQTPPIFNLLSKYTEESDKYRTFNMGVGMVLVCSQENADLVAKESGGYIFGELKEGNNKVIFV